MPGTDAVPGIPVAPEGPGWAAFGYPLAYDDAFGGTPHAGPTPPHVASFAPHVGPPEAAAPYAAYGAEAAAPVVPPSTFQPPHVAPSHVAPSEGYVAWPGAASSAPHVAPRGALPGAAGTARAALSLGVVALVAYALAFTVEAGGAVALWFLGLVTGVLAVVCGAVGTGRARRAGGPGRGMSLTGLVCGVVGLVGGLAVLAAGFVLAVGEEDADGGATHEYHAEASSVGAHGYRAASR
ncbi:hypothetical protein ACQYWQ_23125 [Streptomyces sp. P6-2-1]|uniref:hypothetical protein n=1 Tax=Streptomyces sp. P6-2-1 TaxID=3422591 RepID=UPI003D35C423